MSGLSSSNFGGNEMCLSGRVAADGAISSGKGFSCSAPSSGVFTITISTVDKYSALSACVVSCVGAGEADFTATTPAAPSSSDPLTSFTVTTRSAGVATPAAKAFSFVAILQE